MKIRLLHNIKHKAIRFIHIQLFISLVSMPILIYWGLPISMLTAVGNLLFAPVLTIFLLLSSLIFFLELLYLPNTWIIWLLEYVTSAWLWLLEWEQKMWLVGFAKPSPLLLLAIPLISFAILQNRYTYKPMRATLCLSVLLIGICAVLKTTEYPAQIVEHVPRASKEVTIIRNNKQVILIDPGCIGSNCSASSWVSYTLIPEIIKQTGSLTVDHFIALQPNGMLFEALDTLCKKITVKKIYLPWWENKISFSAWRKFKNMSETLKETDTKLIHINKKPIHIELGQQSAIHIEPLDKRLTYQEATYPAICVNGQLETDPITIYSAKYKSRKKESRIKQTIPPLDNH